MDVVIQTILVVSIVLLTAVFLAAGVFTIMVLREIKRSGERVNQILDQTNQTVEMVNQSLSVLPQLAQELRDSAKAWGVVKFGLSTIINFLEKKGVITVKELPQVTEETRQDQQERPSDSPIETEDNGESKRTPLRRRFFFKKS